MPNLRAQERSDLAGGQLFLQPGMREAFSIPLGVCAAERFFHGTLLKSGVNEPFHVNFSGEKVCASMITTV
jgi:hypothetical protein